MASPNPMQSVASVLGDDIPTFLLHKSYQGSTRHGELLRDVAAEHGAKLGLGVVVPLHNHTSKMVLNYVDSTDFVPVRIVDPELHHAPSSAFDGKDAGKEKALLERWALYEMPDKPTTKWVRRVLRTQADHGATISLSASGWVDTVNATKSLQQAMTFVTESRDQVGASPMMVNLAMSYDWLVNKDLRSLLFQELVESTEDVWYLRFYWPEVAVRYGQLTDAALLAGYKELAELADVEGKRLFLPNTGLTGWLASAFGASGFSTGSSWGEQAFAQARRMGGRKGQAPPPRLQRFFDRHLLHTLEYAEYDRLSGLPGHARFESRYSREIDASGHDHDLAGLHYLVAAADLQASLSARRPVNVVKREVRVAFTFLDALRRADQPTGLNRPTHLPVWADLLS